MTSPHNSKPLARQAPFSRVIPKYLLQCPINGNRHTGRHGARRIPSVHFNMINEIQRELCSRFPGFPEAAIPQRAYAGLIFDCDGTLTDSMPVHYLAWYATMTPLGIEFPEDRFYALGGMPTEKIIATLATEQQKQVDAKQAAIDKEHAFIKRISLITPIAPVMHVALHFRDRLPIAVASGGYRDIILQQLATIGCRDWFNAIVTAEDTERHKPEPDVFLEAAKRLKVAPQDCLVYEDSDLGIRAAHAAGMDCIDVRAFHVPRRYPVDHFSSASLQPRN
jgi:beta-phosphoglucomutase-like phosphatase (HAD superfamily)